MLPLLNKLSAFISGAPDIRIGVALGRHAMRASILREHDSVWQVEAIREIPAPVSLFEGEPPSDAVKVLAQSLAALLPEAVGNFVPLQLALPGAAVSLRIFSLDTVPKAEQDRVNLVGWRLSQELAVGYKLACAYQILEDGEKGASLLGIGIDGRWLACLTDACRAAQIVPTVIDAGFGFLFNRFHVEIADIRGCSALICLEPESWTLLVIDEHARIKLARSWWRNPAQASGAVAGYPSIALEAEQAIRAYMHGGEPAIQRIAIAGEDPDIKSLAAVLDQRMQQPCHTLAVTTKEMPNSLRPEHRGYSTALAASFDIR